MAIKTAAELAALLKKVATEYKTLYVMGCFGAPMTASNKERYCQNHSYNQQTVRQVMIKSATADTFGFDCVCLIKAILWGWSGNKSHVYGGATYNSNGVPDISADQIINKCKDVSTDFSKLQIGELLWMKGHVGIYIGSGKCVECTPSWKNGVQVTDVLNVKSGTGHSWTKHGKLPYVSYAEAAADTATSGSPAKTEEKPKPKTLPTLRVGSSGDAVEALQHLLIFNEYDCGLDGADGDYGSKTKQAVVKLQQDNNLEDDGIVGPATWSVLTKTS